MPIYEYECKNCNTRFEKLQSITSDSLTVCENCGGGPIRRVLHPVGIIFKGSGWYLTDNRKSPAPSEDAGSKSTESKAAEKKTENKDSTASSPPSD